MKSAVNVLYARVISLSKEQTNEQTNGRKNERTDDKYFDSKSLMNTCSSDTKEHQFG